jgi:16S rRNA pseudouridine516 synthase
MKDESEKMERLDKILSKHGFGSRKDVHSLLAQKRVAVNGEITRSGDMRLSLKSDRIEVDGEPILIQTHAYFMMNKAPGYVCSKKDGAQPSVFNLLSPEHTHTYLGGELSLIGRLDADTEGLLIFSTDGQLNHTLTSPKKKVPKVYLVRLRNSVSEADQKIYAQTLSEGIHIPADGKEAEDDCLPAEIEWHEKKDDGTSDTCHLTLHEGKYHEVKRMFLALGNEVIYLKRISLGSLNLDENLGLGEYRALTESEVSKLKTES